ncbi:MAG: hypothetical protein KME31_26600 [Tolypothrix carrinoi HA7290-LM1]|nr:hypothetical protein [Tolypothrix carrinoi HA7290-LM1]
MVVLSTHLEAEREKCNAQCPMPITHYPLPITHYPLPITHYPLPITHYQPPTLISLRST